MTTYVGQDFLLKLSDGEAPPVYRRMAVLRVVGMTISGAVVESVHQSSKSWRELLAGRPARSVSISASGIFLGSNTEARMRANAMAGTLDRYQLSFECGDKMRGTFLIQRLDFTGSMNGERYYTLQLKSSGEVLVL